METTTTTTTEVIKITVKKLADLLCAITKSTVCNILYKVDDNRSKTVKGQKQIQKLVNVSNVYLNHEYTQKVINLTGNEKFVALPLVGKTRICSTLIQADKTNELMIDGKVLKSETIKVLALYHNGKEITEAEGIAMDLWTPAYYQPKETFTKGRGTVEIEDDFGIINTYLKRIVRIKLEGTLYEVE